MFVLLLSPAVPSKRKDISPFCERGGFAKITVGTGVLSSTATLQSFLQKTDHVHSLFRVAEALSRSVDTLMTGM